MRAGLSIKLIKFIDTFIFPGKENTIVVVILITIITWESARFIRIKSFQESFIIWAYIVYISDYTNSQFSDNI